MVPHVKEFNKINCLEKVFHERSHPAAPSSKRAGNERSQGESRIEEKVGRYP